MTLTHDPPEALIRALARQAAPSSDFDLNPPDPQARARKLRPAAVLIGVMASESGGRLILTKRASHLKHHPGQIAFPGGKVNSADADAVAAALREAQEEIGLDPALVTVLGSLPPHETVTGFKITPVLGWVGAGFVPVAEAGEVQEVFTVPLRHVFDPQRFRVEQREWLGQTRRYYAVPYGPYYIWGATARILRGLADRMAGCD